MAETVLAASEKIILANTWMQSVGATRIWTI
jgi:hypothetical protein